MPALDRLGLTAATAAPAAAHSDTQTQTKEIFGFKWAKRETYESDHVQDFARQWLFERYCNNDPQRLSDWLAGDRKIILDAGCGSGYSALLFFADHLKQHDYLGVDISSAVDVAKVRFAERDYPADFLQVSLLDLPVPDDSVDLIFSEGVLHHTDNTGDSIAYLAKKLRPGGRFLFYVYAKKAVIREFTDDHIRAEIKAMPDEQAWEALMALTKLGKVLGDLKIEIDIPEAIPYLGIPKGKLDLQRFFYWNICKLYYRPDYSLEEMNHINFDWFRPLNCHRHTRAEVEGFCQAAGLIIEALNEQESGITVVARKG
ncbi:MAG: class I SAM-dependent methyltransferase [Candidatus Sericytochromatia bacterium]|nr:class I SAM-dependent methyltransferase [Candidatus Sericytochromatia bacterium]